MDQVMYGNQNAPNISTVVDEHANICWKFTHPWKRKVWYNNNNNNNITNTPKHAQELQEFEDGVRQEGHKNVAARAEESILKGIKQIYNVVDKSKRLCAMNRMEYAELYSEHYLNYREVNNMLPSTQQAYFNMKLINICERCSPSTATLLQEGK